MVGPRWEGKIGSPVTVTDGDYGRLQQLLVDPGQERVVGLLVRPHGWLPPFRWEQVLFDGERLEEIRNKSGSL